MCKKSSHLINILSDLIAGKERTSIDTKASNSNQYFGTIKNQGIELIEVWRPNLTNKGRSKHRRLNPTEENISKAKEYLAKLQGVKNETKN